MYMQIHPFPFQTIDWQIIDKELHHGATGTAYWQIFNMGEIRIRLVEYSANYLADHWCKKGHIIFCVEGEMETELEDQRRFTLCKGMTYHVGDDCEAHRSSTKVGCKLFIVD